MIILIITRFTSKPKSMKAITRMTALIAIQCLILINVFAQQEKPLNVAILIFDEVQIIDYAGPWEVLGGVGNRVFTVAKSREPITTVLNMKVIPDYSFADAPHADILVIPGGGGPKSQGGSDPHLPTQDTPELLNWIRSSADQATYVLSVCNGALLLGKAGLLKGLSATTTFGMFDALRRIEPTATVVENKRFVDNGTIVTSAGLSSGIDAALHIVEKLNGRGAAQMHALGLEYNWDPQGNWARGSLADRYMMFMYKNVKGAESLARQGDSNRWENQWVIDPTIQSEVEVLDAVNATIQNNLTYGPPRPAWKLVSKRSDGSTWSFVDERGIKWTGNVEIQKAESGMKRPVLKVSVRKNAS